jgi:hypothetical protein
MRFGMSINCRIKASLNERSPIDSLWRFASILTRALIGRYWGDVDIGGITDGRGLAAAPMLGADGALIGSRFWASTEALVHLAFHKAAIAADGDSATRTTVVGIVRKVAWPKPFTARVMKNRFVDEWHGRESEFAETAVLEHR